MNALALAAALLLSAAPVFAATPASATIGAVEGGVETLLDGVEPWVPASVGQELTPGSRLRTGSKGSAVVVFFDGSKVRVGKGTQFTIDSAEPSNIMTSLGLGSLQAWVTKLKGRKFQVRTGAMVAAVRGTVFAVETPDGKVVHVDLFSGSLACNDVFGHQTMLAAGQSLSASASAGAFAPKPLPAGHHAPAEPKVAAGPPPPPPSTQTAQKTAPPPPPSDATTSDASTAPPPPPPPNPAQDSSVTGSNTSTVSPSSPH